MNKRLVAVAVAGAFAAPTAAFAQSSVTISGKFHGGFESLKYSNSAKLNNSHAGLVDDSSRILFNVVEDLGGGLQAIGQMDIRFKMDDPGRAASANGTNIGATNTGNVASGNTHVGLRSKQWGRLILGRQDLHYGGRESDLTVRGSLRADSISILSYTVAGAIAYASRTQNVVHYTTPNWGGFTLIAAYSSSPLAAEADIGSGIRKGRAWNLNPNMQGRNWQVGYSYWSAKIDGQNSGTSALTAAALVDQRGDRLYGSYAWGGFKLGLAWDKSTTKTPATGAQTSNRTAWSIPLSYTWGAHSIHAHFNKARKDRAAANAALDTKATMFAISYGYDLSKRTSAALTYARINNGAASAYDFFTSSSLGLSNNAQSTIAAGEDPRMWGVTLRHQF
jgi:predicted porin